MALPGTQPLHEHDRILQATCEAVVMKVAEAIEAEDGKGLTDLSVPGGPMVGRQLTIDATEKDGKLNKCRLTLLDADLAPEGEAARIEYEDDKETKHGLTRVYSIQSVRRRQGHLELLENFLARKSEDVREADFRPIESEAYAQSTVLGTLTDWVRYRAWQLQEKRKK